MGFVPPKKFLLADLHRIHLSYSFSRLTKKSQHQLLHKTTMAVWRLVMACLLMIFCICSLKL